MVTPKAPVLIVDDTPMNLKLARVALEGAGYDVRMAADGEEAWALLASFRPSVILMDLQMPGVDGFELTRRIRGDADKAEIKIVAVTAYAMKGDRERALAAGCDGYIAKPIDPILLPGLIASHLGAPLPVKALAHDGSPILVVEDNPTSRKLVRVALESDGYSVVEVGEGRAALDWLAANRARLIVQDLVLPDMDGLELVRRLRALPFGRAVPIICLSGFLARMDDARAVEDGFSALLLKPVDPIQLLEVVRSQLCRPRDLPPMAASDRSIRVLVVDDDPLQRRLAEYQLSGVGFEVTSVGSAREAIEFAERALPDAIVSDVLMPELDGFELCLQVRRHPRLARVPVILVSAFSAEASDRRLAEQVGANGFVERSGDWAGALELVRGALSEPAAARPSLDPEHAREAILRRTVAQLHRQLRVNSELSHQCLLDAAQLAVLAGVADALAAHSKLENVLADVLALCLDISGISKGALYLQAGSQLRPAHSIGFSAAEVTQLDTCFGHMSLLERLVEGGQVVAFPSPAVESEVAAQFLASAGIKAALIVPVAWGKLFYGALLLGARSVDVTAHEPAAFARVLGAQMGQAIGLADAFKRLAASEERFRALVASMDDVLVVDRAQRVIGLYGRVHEAADVDAYLGKPLEQTPGPSPAHGLSQAYARALAGESVVYDWSRGVGADTLHFQDALWPVRNAQAEVDSVVRVRRNVTEQTRLQAQVMVSDRMVSVGMLAAGVAHEINNPLMAVLGNLELVLESAPEAMPAELRESLEDALLGSKRVQAIVGDLRLFSRAESEHVGAVDIEAVLESTLRLARNEIRHRAKLVKEYAGVPYIRGNESRLGQVFLNLLVNAAQAIPEGRADSNEIRLATRLDAKGRVLVEIRDTGCGIAPELAKQLFAPFVTTKPAGVGTGLGLSICQRIVTQLGGEIGFESEVGRGTTFRVALAVAAAPAPAQLLVASGRPAGRRGRIAMIDDETVLGVLVSRALGREHDVECFSDASSALERIQRGAEFDLILCDLTMPVITGVEFYERLSVLRPELAQRTIFLTGGAFTHEASAFLASVPNMCICKPFDLVMLRALVNERVS